MIFKNNIPQAKITHRRRSVKARFFLCFLVLLIVGALTMVGLGYIKLSQIQKSVFVGNQTTYAQDKSLAGDFKSKTPINILLLGYGGGNHDGAYLTDSIIVAHLDPSVKKVTLISIPRDTWVNIPTNGDTGSYWKINASYELGLDDVDYPNKQPQFQGDAGGGNLAKYTVQKVTGLKIDRFVAMDFSGFKKTIDALGGVDINVQKTFDDYEYPIDGREDDLCGHPQSDLSMLEVEATQSGDTVAFPCRYEHLHFDSGLQHMDGEASLSYVRSRHSLQDGTDFGRSTRQRLLLAAVKDRIFSLGFIPKIIPFSLTLADDFKTDMSPDELKFFISQADNLKGYQINNLALSDQNVLQDFFTDDGQYALMSQQGGLDQWSSVQNWILASLNPSLTNTEPIIKVENGSGIPGLAALATNRLQDKDFNVLSPSNYNGSEVAITTVTLYSKNIDQKMISEIEQEFGVKSVDYQQSSDGGYNILIVVGQDYNLLQGKKLING